MKKFLFLMFLLLCFNIHSDDELNRSDVIEGIVRDWDIEIEAFTVDSERSEVILYDYKSETYFDVREAVITTLYALGGYTDYLRENRVSKIDYCWSIDTGEYCMTIPGDWLKKFVETEKHKDKIEMAGKLVDRFTIQTKAAQVQDIGSF